MKRLTDNKIKCMADFCEAQNCVNYESDGCCSYERYQRLAEYEDAEEQGLLVRLPCRLGIPIYCLWGDDIFTETIEMICVSDKGFYLETENMGFDESDIGKVVFLTREAAEKALEDA